MCLTICFRVGSGNSGLNVYFLSDTFAVWLTPYDLQKVDIVDRKSY